MDAALNETLESLEHEKPPEPAVPVQNVSSGEEAEGVEENGSLQ